ncbi:MAG TPA: hypothetical protein VIC08_00700 [Cellvibrionaceae bacterium]
MTFTHLVKAAAFAIAFSGLSACSQEAQDKEVWLSSEEVIRFNGKITQKKVNELKQLYASALIKPTILQINSYGGNGSAGLDLGYWLYGTQLSVRVKKKCGSSCANYVMPAAKKIYLDSSAMLAWHGGFNQANLLDNFKKLLSGEYEHSSHEASFSKRKSEPMGDDEAEGSLCPLGSAEDIELRKIVASDENIEDFSEEKINILLDLGARCLTAMAQKERDFFAMINVDPQLPYYGQQGKYQPLYQSREHFGFYYTLDDMRKMNFPPIELKAGVWEPEKNERFKKAGLYLVELD